MAHKRMDNGCIIIQSSYVTTSRGLSQMSENSQESQTNVASQNIHDTDSFVDLTIDFNASDISLKDWNTITRPRRTLKKPKRYIEDINDENCYLKSQLKSADKYHNILNRTNDKRNSRADNEDCIKGSDGTKLSLLLNKTNDANFVKSVVPTTDLCQYIVMPFDANQYTAPPTYKIFHLKTSGLHQSDPLEDIRNDCYGNLNTLVPQDSNGVLLQEDTDSDAWSDTGTSANPVWLREIKSTDKHGHSYKDNIKDSELHAWKKCRLEMTKTDMDEEHTAETEKNDGTKYDVVIKNGLTYMHELLHIQSEYFQDYLHEEKEPDVEVIANNIHYQNIEKMSQTILKHMK